MLCRKNLHEMTEDNIHVFKRRNGTTYNTCKKCYRKKSANGKLKHLYGITLEDYEKLLDAQGGICAICSSDDPGSIGKRKLFYFSVDHDHACCPTKHICGKCIRGLLCHQCNMNMGAIDRWTADELDLALKYKATRSR